MDAAELLVLSVARFLQERAFAAISATTAPRARRAVRARALAPGGLDADLAALRASLAAEPGAVGRRLAAFLVLRRALSDAPPPRASRAAAAPWLLALAAELPATRGLAPALAGPEDAWRAYVVPLDRARDIRLQLGVAAALMNLPPRLPDARPGARAF